MATKTPHQSPYKAQLSATIRPQDDFFNYVNRSWIDANPIPPSESRWSIFNQLHDESLAHMKELYEELQSAKDLQPGSIRQQARDLYYTGMHVDDYESAHLEFVASQLARIDSMTQPRDLSKLIGGLQAIGVSSPWAAYIDADDKDGTKHIFRFHQDGLTLPDRDYYLEDNDKMRAIRDAYKKHLRSVYSHFPALAESAQQFVDTVLEFETAIATVSRSRTALRDVEANYHKTAYTDVATQFPAIDWPAYAQALGWQPDNKISINQPEFMSFINDQITARPLHDWKILLKWHFLVIYLSKISERFAQLKFEFFGKVLSGSEEIMPLWKRVASTIDGCIGEGVGRLYAERYFAESSKQQVLTMVEEMRQAYAERIRALDWMEDATKKFALKKLANMKVLIGYPDKWRDFSGLHIDRTSYMGNVVAAERFLNEYWLAKLHEPTSRDDWFMHPQTVNAYHDPNRLVICFPAAILQPPFFDPHASLAANYGGIGTVIGHEFTHGFDDQGCQFDDKGNVRTWQTKADRTAFNERAQVIVDQADHFEVLPGLHLRGKLVLGESIADLGGLEISLHALRTHLGKELTVPGKDGLTPLHVFFINYATTECGQIRDEKLREYTLSDPHPAAPFRVNGMLQHVDEFYRTFDVKEGDGLYRAPAARAKIW